MVICNKNSRLTGTRLATTTVLMCSISLHSNMPELRDTVVGLHSRHLVWASYRYYRQYSTIAFVQQSEPVPSSENRPALTLLVNRSLCTGPSRLITFDCRTHPCWHHQSYTSDKGVFLAAANYAYKFVSLTSILFRLSVV